MEKSLELQLAQSLIEKITDLPTIPAVAIRIQELLGNPDVKMEEVVDMVLTDQVLAARVIKIVNSPLYRPVHEIKSVKHALIYLGFRHIRHLVFTCSLMGMFQEKESAFDVRTFWEHSFGVGIVSRLIAQRVRYPDIEKAYLAGIIHDIGEVFLSSYLKEDFLKILETMREEPQRLIDAEQRILGTTHCQIGFCIASKWNFPLDYRETIQCHHAPHEAVLNPMLAAIVNLADLFCSVRELNHDKREWVSFNLAEEEGWKIVARFTPQKLNFDAERFCYELDDKVPEIRDLVKSIY